jgi:hypothetical protein
MSIFAQKLRKSGDATGIARIVSHIQADMASSGTYNRSVADAAISPAMEGLSHASQSALNTAVDEMDQLLKNFAASEGLNKGMESFQFEAGVVAGVCSGNVLGYLRQPVERQMVSSATNVVVQNTAVGSHASFERPSMEAFDEKDNHNLQAYSVAYNMMSSRQDTFGEAFFPTTVVTADSNGYSVSVRLVQVYNDLHRQISGNIDDFKKKNILLGLVDPTILQNEKTRVIPVNRAQSAQNFVAPALVPPYSVVIDNETIPTAPLAIGASFSLLGLSQTDTLIANGLMDSTDAIDTAVYLSNVYMHIGNDVIKFNTQQLPLAAWMQAPQGLARQMNLQFSSKSLAVMPNTKNMDGSALTTLSAIATGNYVVRLKADLFGTLNLELGDCTVNAGKVSVASVTDVSGVLLDLTTGVGKTISDAVAAGSVIGYDLFAYRTNSNRRQRGQLLDITNFTQTYPVPLRAPVTALRPVTADGSNDNSDLQALVDTTRIRTSNDAVGTLIAAANTLSDYVDSRDTLGMGSDTMGIGRFLVIPQFRSLNIDMLTAVQSIKSEDRMADLQAVLLNAIKDMSLRMYRDSNYRAASDSMAGGLAKKPTIIIGTDPVLAGYLTVVGDTRTLGSEFEVMIVSTNDIRMRGQIAVTFGTFDGATAGPNPLHFGNMAWKPEMTIVMPSTARGGAYTRELTVSPSFLHVVNLPVLGMIKVTNVPDVVASVLPFQTKAV